jgi:mRNA-degrading endonuclease RelE of RelBE toxin-antitoxin system
MRIEPTTYFLRQLKRLSKKYPSIKSDIRNLSDSLQDNPTQGTPIRRGAFKIRMSITSKGQGKSGGSRVITYVRDERNTLYLVDIYDKSERSNISDADLDSFIDLIDTL